MKQDHQALHFEILHALPGRLRIHLEKPIESDGIFRRAEGVTRCSYNPKTQNLLVEYSPEEISESGIIVRLGALYAGEKQADFLHIKRSDEDRFSVGPTGGLALGLIGLDGIMKLTGAQLAGLTGWFSAGATLAAIIEHGYQELQVRGSFDPEVMSIIYLINSIGKTNTFHASLLAWAATFGRHLVPQSPREQEFRVRKDGRSITLIPIQERSRGTEFAEKMLSRGSEMLAK